MELLRRIVALGERGAGRVSVDARCQSAGLGETAHRPFPLPRDPWVQAQTWRGVLFAHWPVPVETLRRVVPAELPVDTFAGTGWLGIVPFAITGARPRATPPLSWFLETNVRTYTTVGGRPGVWFLSLDAASALAVAGARLTYRLPYFRAHMRARRQGGRIEYETRRVDGRAALSVSYGPAGDAVEPAPGTLEHFLIERYCLYALGRRGRLLSADIHHPPWRLQPAEAEITHNTMTSLALPGGDPLLHYAERQDVVIWPPRRVA